MEVMFLRVQGKLTEEIFERSFQVMSKQVIEFSSMGGSAEIKTFQILPAGHLLLRECISFGNNFLYL
jgi:hypothetical protein